jgi:hypothetical protein
MKRFKLLLKLIKIAMFMLLFWNRIKKLIFKFLKFKEKCIYYAQREMWRFKLVIKIKKVKMKILSFLYNNMMLFRWNQFKNFPSLIIKLGIRIILIVFYWKLLEILNLYMKKKKYII